LGSGAAVVAFVVGSLQYQKAQRWKRAEFLAAEMKGFFADPDISNVLTMIDWAPRRVNLYHIADTELRHYPKITRRIQIEALEPHTKRQSGGSSVDLGDSEDTGDSGTQEGVRGPRYSPEEVRIRDSYDKFLDFLERVDAYAESKLIGKEDLDPYLRYWINDIASYSEDSDDGAWTCALLNYIEFYDFTNVQQLFARYGYNIETHGPIYERQLLAIKDNVLAQKLRDSRKPQEHRPRKMRLWRYRRREPIQPTKE
jgi:hypothetical protein